MNYFVTKTGALKATDISQWVLDGGVYKEFKLPKFTPNA